MVIIPTGNVGRAHLLDERAQLSHIHVPLERMRIAWIIGLVDHQVRRTAPAGADVRVGCVEVHVGGHELARVDKGGAQDVFRRTALVRRYKVSKTKHIADRRLQPMERAGAGIRLVAADQGCPLVLAHGSSARIGQQVDVDVLGPNGEHVVASRSAGAPRVLGAR